MAALIDGMETKIDAIMDELDTVRKQLDEMKEQRAGKALKVALSETVEQLWQTCIE